jgi:hypothetical protein
MGTWFANGWTCGFNQQERGAKTDFFYGDIVQYIYIYLFICLFTLSLSLYMYTYVYMYIYMYIYISINWFVMSCFRTSIRIWVYDAHWLSYLAGGVETTNLINAKECHQTVTKIRSFQLVSIMLFFATSLGKLLHVVAVVVGEHDQNDRWLVVARGRWMSKSLRNACKR